MTEFPALSRDPRRGVVQASWLGGGRRYGLYGVLARPPGDPPDWPRELAGFRQFVGFAWDPESESLAVVGSEGDGVPGTVEPSGEGEELRAELEAGLARLLSRSGGS